MLIVAGSCHFIRLSVVYLVEEAQNSHSVTQLFIPAVIVNTVLGDTPYPQLFQVSHLFEEEEAKKAVQGFSDEGSKNRQWALFPES